MFKRGSLEVRSVRQERTGELGYAVCAFRDGAWVQVSQWYFGMMPAVGAMMNVVGSDVA